MLWSHWHRGGAPGRRALFCRWNLSNGYSNKGCLHRGICIHPQLYKIEMQLSDNILVLESESLWEGQYAVTAWDQTRPSMLAHASVCSPKVLLLELLRVVFRVLIRLGGRQASWRLRERSGILERESAAACL
eukprot:TRINITY_DN44423_c0_g1_i1.p1 TRINITY_DN44423_c0_g1~~TRINITY_DN44423_c0_g1_i1.p1  ORF type:complete len:132 (+),score=0.93 TRINITY_DN44423_c0_g1_i1:215-610(+)